VVKTFSEPGDRDFHGILNVVGKKRLDRWKGMCVLFFPLPRSLALSLARSHAFALALFLARPLDFYLALFLFHYGVATISRLLEIIGLFCKRAL